MMKVAVCGLGMMGQAHLRNLLKIDDVRLAAVCDTDPAKLEPTSQVAGNIDFGPRHAKLDDVPRFVDPNRMLDQVELDALICATPTDCHADLAIRGLDAGLHVFSEKPIALTVEQGQAMCDAAERAGKVLFIGHVVRFFPAYQKIYQLIRSAPYGQLLAADFSRTCGLPGWGGRNWFADPARSGGMPVDLHIHDVDFVLHALGAPPELRTYRVSNRRTGVDVIRTMYLYDGALVTSYGAWVQRSGGFSAWATVTFEEATLTWHTDRAGELLLLPAEGEPETIELPNVDGYETELREFVRCANAGQPSPAVSPQSALAALRVTHLEMESARQDAPVRLC